MARNVPLNVTENDLPWLAGLLEGEGCFSWWKDGTGTPYPLVVVGMADKDVIERVARMFNRSVCKRNPGSRGTKPIYHTRVVGSHAVKLMKLLQPFMGERRKARIAEIISNV